MSPQHSRSGSFNEDAFAPAWIWSFLQIFGLLPFFFICRRYIRGSVPVGSLKDPDITYDPEGNPTEFTDALYREKVKNDADQISNPFRKM